MLSRKPNCIKLNGSYLWLVYLSNLALPLLLPLIFFICNKNNIISISHHSWTENYLCIHGLLPNSSNAFQVLPFRQLRLLYLIPHLMHQLELPMRFLQLAYEISIVGIANSLSPMDHLLTAS